MRVTILALSALGLLITASAATGGPSTTNRDLLASVDPATSTAEATQETEDRIGLLYEISQTFSELDIDISAAKISTEKGAAIDTFYVRELSGGKVVSPERHRAIERRLRQAIQTLDSR